MSRASIQQWAKANLEVKGDSGKGPYPTWERMWIDNESCCTELRVFRLCENDIGADVVLCTCPGGYGANDEDWRGINMGHVTEVEEFIELWRWYRNQYGEPCPRKE
jgi:hypothetical protein